MEQKELNHSTVACLYQHNQDYVQRAFLRYTDELLQHQALRMEQLSAELDGTLWNHEKW